jgi:nitrogen fixation protein NifQ
MRRHVQGIDIMTDDTSSSSQQVQAVLAAADIRARELTGDADGLPLPDAWLFARLVAAREVRDEMALLGVPQPQLHALFRRYFAQVDLPPPARSTLLKSTDHAEFVAALINLLLTHTAPTVLSDDARCLAAIIAHACLRPDHMARSRPERPRRCYADACTLFPDARCTQCGGLTVEEVSCARTGAVDRRHT